MLNEILWQKYLNWFDDMRGFWEQPVRARLEFWKTVSKQALEMIDAIETDETLKLPRRACDCGNCIMEKKLKTISLLELQRYTHDFYDLLRNIHEVQESKIDIKRWSTMDEGDMRDLLEGLGYKVDPWL